MSRLSRPTRTTPEPLARIWRPALDVLTSCPNLRRGAHILIRQHLRRGQRPQLAVADASPVELSHVPTNTPFLHLLHAGPRCRGSGGASAWYSAADGPTNMTPSSRTSGSSGALSWHLDTANEVLLREQHRIQEQKCVAQKGKPKRETWGNGQRSNTPPLNLDSVAPNTEIFVTGHSARRVVPANILGAMRDLAVTEELQALVEEDGNDDHDEDDDGSSVDDDDLLRWSKRSAFPDDRSCTHARCTLRRLLPLFYLTCPVRKASQVVECPLNWSFTPPCVQCRCPQSRDTPRLTRFTM